MAASELFTVTFWEVTATQVIHAGAGAAAAVLAAHAFGLLGSVPWYGVLSAAALSGVGALLLALAGKANPATGPASLFVPQSKAAKQATAARRHPTSRGNGK